MKHLLLAALLGLPVSSRAADTACECGKPGCEASCTCSQGVCPLHRPKADAGKPEEKAEPPPVPGKKKDRPADAVCQ